MTDTDNGKWDAQAVAKGLSDAQRRVLHGDSPVSMSQAGGWTGASDALARTGLMKPNGELTSRGREVLAALSDNGRG